MPPGGISYEIEWTIPTLCVPSAKHALELTLLDVSLLHPSDVNLNSLQSSMIAILSGLDAPPPPPPPVYHPKTAGIIYEGHAHGQPWRYSNAATSASTPSDHVNKAVAAIDLEGEDMNPTDGGVATVDQLEKLFDKAADTSDLAQVLNRFGLEPEDPMELVVGEAEEGDLTTDERARTDIHCVNPHEFIADAISDALFDGLTWESVQGARQKLVLRPTRFSYEKSGKPSCPCQRRFMESTERLYLFSILLVLFINRMCLMYPWSQKARDARWRSWGRLHGL